MLESHPQEAVNGRSSQTERDSENLVQFDFLRDSQKFPRLSRQMEKIECWSNQADRLNILVRRVAFAWSQKSFDHLLEELSALPLGPHYADLSEKELAQMGLRVALPHRIRSMSTESSTRIAYSNFEGDFLEYLYHRHAANWDNIARAFGDRTTRRLSRSQLESQRRSMRKSRRLTVGPSRSYSDLEKLTLLVLRLQLESFVDVSSSFNTLTGRATNPQKLSELYSHHFLLRSIRNAEIDRLCAHSGVARCDLANKNNTFTRVGVTRRASGVSGRQPYSPAERQRILALVSQLRSPGRIPWKKVATLFNVNPPAGVQRTALGLKLFYYSQLKEDM